MILLGIFLTIAVIGIVILKINLYSLIGEIFTIIGVFVSVVMILIIICIHVGVNVQIEENRIEYDSLCERYEIITSEYEDVSRSDVIKDIAEWNMRVHNYKYWSYNPWTNWFYSRRIADDMKMIERRTDE